MKQFNSLLFGVLLGFSMCFIACDSNEWESNFNVGTKVDTETKDNYYVKYIIKCDYPAIFSDWTVTTPEGTYSKMDYQTRGWNQTYGPVKKGFKCEAIVERGKPTIEIHVAKNEEPFALKRITTTGSALYVIGY